MRHAYQSDADPTDRPPIAESDDPGRPTDGDQANDVSETVIGTYWAHSVTSEIVGVITEGGLVPGDDLDQMSDALDEMVTDAINGITPPAVPDFATRNEHIQEIPPDDEFANPADSRFAIRSYLAARA